VTHYDLIRDLFDIVDNFWEDDTFKTNVKTQ